MFKKETTASQEYSAPACEIVENLPEEVLCVSPGGTTEDFDDLGDYNW